MSGTKFFDNIAIILAALIRVADHQLDRHAG